MLRASGGRWSAPSTVTRPPTAATRARTTTTTARSRTRRWTTTTSAAPDCAADPRAGARRSAATTRGPIPSRPLDPRPAAGSPLARSPTASPPVDGFFQPALVQGCLRRQDELGGRLDQPLAARPLPATSRRSRSRQHHDEQTWTAGNEYVLTQPIYVTERRDADDRAGHRGPRRAVGPRPRRRPTTRAR